MSTLQQELRKSVEEALQFFERSTRNLTEEDSEYAPVAGAYTASQHVAHVALTLDWFLEGAFAPGGFDMDFASHDKQARAVTSLAAARRMVERSGARFIEKLSSLSESEWRAPIAAGPIMGGMPRFHIVEGLVDHTAHHRGALTVYTRLRGKVPPMPYMEM